MTPLDQSFPGFVEAIGYLHSGLMPVGFGLLVLSFASEFGTQPPDLFGMLKFILKLFLIVMLIANAHQFINDGQLVVQQWVEQHIKARPENVAARYQEKLAEAQNAPGRENESLWDTLIGGSLYEAVVYGLLTFIAWLAMLLMYFIYMVQRAALLVCWALTPVLFACFALRQMSGQALRHLLRTLAIMLWPVGNAFAAALTEGLITNMVDQNFLAGQSFLGSLGYGLQNFLGIVVVAIWIIFSTLFAPLLIQRVIVGSAGFASVISKSSDLILGVAAPGLVSVASSLWASRHSSDSSSRSRGDSRGTEVTTFSPVTDLPPQSGDSTTPEPWEPTIADPTGEQEVQAIVAATKTT